MMDKEELEELEKFKEIHNDLRKTIKYLEKNNDKFLKTQIDACKKILKQVDKKIKEGNKKCIK